MRKFNILAVILMGGLSVSVACFEDNGSLNPESSAATTEDREASDSSAESSSEGGLDSEVPTGDGGDVADEIEGDEDTTVELGDEEQGDESSDSVETESEEEISDDATLGLSALMLGDSLLAWYAEEEASVGHLLEEETGMRVENLAVSGALFLEGEQTIPEQYISGDWDWVVFDGGGNDANDLCECGDCSEIVDQLVGPTASSGRVPEFVDELQGSGHRVLILGYYRMPDTADFGFNRCNDEAELLNQRYRLVAESNEDVFFLDLGRVVSPANLRDYDEDHVHPSESGIQKMSEAIAEHLRTIVHERQSGSL